MKLVFLTLFHALFSPAHSFSPFTRIFVSQCSEKWKVHISQFSHPSWEHFEGSFFFLSQQWMFWNRWWAYNGQSRQGEGKAGGWGGHGNCMGSAEYTILMQQSQAYLFLCLRSSFLFLRFKLDELVGWKGTEWVRRPHTGSLLSATCKKLKCLQVRSVLL